MSPPIEVVDRAVTNARERESDRIAWNLPRRPRDTDTYGAPIQPDFESGLDWEAFSARYFPGSRRHNLGAIVAYGAYKRGSPQASEKATMPEQMIGEAPLETELGASGAGIPRNAGA
jgi:hypothetical protein